MASAQIPFSIEHETWQSSFQSLPHCRRIWNIRAARFDPCCLPYIAIIPLLLAALVLLKYPSQLINGHLPTWTKPFIQEVKETSSDVEDENPHRPLRATFALLATTLVGLVLQLTATFLPVYQPLMVYSCITWSIIVLIILVERPRTASMALLILFSGIICVQLIMLTHATASINGSQLITLSALAAAFLAITIILNMNLRDPSLPNKDISPVYTTPTIELRTPEDNLTPWQYMTVSWMIPLINKGVTKEMEDDDVWDLGYEFKHLRLHQTFRELPGSVTRRIFSANGADLVRTSLLGLVRLASALLAPVLLQRILASMNDPLSPKSATMTYAFIGLFVRLLSAQLNVFNVWYQRRAYERCRGEMVMMLYEKTLNRKILGAKQEEGKVDENGHTNGQVNGHWRSINGQSNGAHGARKSAKDSLVTRLKRLSFSLFQKVRRKTEQETQKENEAASTGKILNLMRSDVYEIAQRFWDFSDFVVKPMGAIFSILLIWRMLGWACLLGVLALGAAQLLVVALARVQVYIEKKRRAVTDEKLKRINQFVESIRHLRWYGWQETWLKDIMDSREKELHLRILSTMISTTLSFILRLGSGLFPAVAFYAFTKLAGQPLRVDIIFPAFDLFNLLENYLRALPDLLTTILNAYVAMSRIERFMKEPDKEKANVVPEDSADLGLQDASFAWPGVEIDVLKELTLSFPPGLTVIHGEVAAGKTALLQALLGELDHTGGEFTQPDQVVGYCSQTPWLQSMSIRDNILFSYPYEEARYKEVVEACALLPDMAEFKHGDLSNIGENGIGLSGGQKARVALARAIYSNAKVLLLDDPLSALDHQTAAFIVRKLLGGPLLEGKTTILATHRMELCHEYARQWIEMSEGRAILHKPSRAEDMEALRRIYTNESLTDEERKQRSEEESSAVPEKFIDDEHRAKGGVKLSVYWRYIKAGTLTWWAAAIVVMTVYRVVDVGQSWLVKSWGESYDHGKPKGIYNFLPPAEENVIPWLWTFFAFLMVVSVLYWGVNLVMFGVAYQAGRTLFKKTLDRVAHANFRFYDTTPVGRLMNRLTSDMVTIDGNLGHMITIFAWQIIGWVASIIVIMSATPVFLAFGVLLFIGFVYHFFRYLPTSQSLRRLEMVSLSPLMSNFGVLVEGLATVRAFNAQERFQTSVIGVVDKFQKNDHFYWSVQSWLGLRFSVLSASATLVMTLIAVYTGISPGLTAFILIAANRFVIHTEWMCKMYGMLEMDFTSVERVIELLDVETEAPGVVKPAAHWPTYSGGVEFKDVTVRYARHLDPALHNITLKIPAGSNTAVIGRTGSGKSTLALSLLATVEIESGTILIDGVDISTVNKQALRSRVTFLAQEPVLFPGSMRKNLDPLDEYSDAACESVLGKIAGSHNWTLTTNVEGGGKGLSQGQRQLVGLARAMLRQSAVLIMDEATASIDFETAQRIQMVLREEMKHSTVITIAHRLEAVKNADYCVVLGKGRLLKAGKAAEMLKECSEYSQTLA